MGFLVIIFRFLVFFLVVVSLFCQYHSQVIGWKDLSSKRAIVSSGTLNSTNSTQDLFAEITWYEVDIHLFSFDKDHK